MRHNNFYASWFLVQDNHNEWPMRICPATIRSYCILHSLKSFAETNSAKTAKKKKKLQVTLKQRTWHGRLRPRYIASGVISYKNSPKIHHFLPLHPPHMWLTWMKPRAWIHFAARSVLTYGFFAYLGSTIIPLHLWCIEWATEERV